MKKYLFSVSCTVALALLVLCGREAAAQTDLPPCKPQRSFHNCWGTFTWPNGNRYEGEWWYDKDRQRLLLIPPIGCDLKKTTIEAKRRADCIDLSGRQHVTVEGIHFRGGGKFESLSSAYRWMARLH